MKIAVLLFGHLRNFETCADSLRENVLDRYDCDLFMHTWDERDVKTKTWHQQICEPTLFDKEVVGKLIQEKYAPKAYEITHQEKWEYEQLIQSSFRSEYQFSTAGMHFLMLSMNIANELRHKYERENNVQYDYVLVTRPDIQFHNYFDIGRVIEQAKCYGLDLNMTRFYAYHISNSHSSIATLLDSASDVLFFAYPNVIDRFIEVNKNIDVEYAKNHSLGINSIFVCREIECGIMPIPIGYVCGYDWSFSAQRIDGEQPKPQSRSTIKSAIIMMTRVLLAPISYIFHKYPGVNIYK